MPLSEDDGQGEGVADEYSEPDLTPEEIEALEYVGEKDPDPEPEFPVRDEPEPEGPEADADGYAPYNLAETRPSVHDPVVVGGKIKSVLRDEEGNPLPEFDESCKDDFTGLAFIGALSKTFEWLGHKFVIRTITVGEALSVTLLTAIYADTLGNGLAYRTAMAAMAVQQVDGKDLPLPVGNADPNSLAYAQQRFDFASSQWFQFTIDAIYNEYLELDLKVRKVVDAMGKASSPTGLIPG